MIEVNLMAAMAKIGPMYITATPRLEMNGATLMLRIALKIVQAAEECPPTVVYFIGDSETVLASREKTSGYFGEYYGNRIGEQFDNQRELEKISRVRKNGEWYHIPSEFNAADRLSRLD